MPSVDARVLSLFRAFMDLDARQRPGFLAEIRHDDPQAHTLLSAMIAADAIAHPLDEPLHLPANAHDDTAPGSDTEGDERIGTRLGPWRIVRKIGAGGMGIVYEAQRDDRQYLQRVALKCARVELASPRLVEAVLTERNHLARLQHPNITALLDGGLDHDGHPWFALQYVEGLPIDEWCDRYRKTLEERVAVLGQACDALAYAHAEGVLHQDLKPSNLLVTAEGRVQLLDFGLSSPLSAHSEAASMPIALTPGYTAPEIVFQGTPPSVASDLYSFGMVMRRLLAGSSPCQSLLTQASRWMRSSPADDGLVQAAIAAPPGVAESRGLSDNRALARRLAGGLDAIVERCTQADPRRRYASAQALAEDLKRWSQQRPVDARDGARLYRARLFLRRHRLALGLTAAIVATAAVGIGATLWQAQRAQRETEAALAVNRLFEDTLGTATLSGLGDTPFSSTELLRKVEMKMRTLDLDEQPRVFAGALTSLARSHAVIGDYSDATRLAGEASRVRDRDDAASAETQATLASLLNLQARHPQAREVARQALQALPDDDANRATRLRLLTEIARSEWELVEHAQAQRSLDRALALARERLDVEPAPYVELLTLRGHWHTRLLNLSAAEADLRRAIALSTGHPSQLANLARERLVRVLTVQERYAEAQAIARQLLDDRRRSLGERHPDTGRAWVVLADSQCIGDRPEDCRASIARGMEILRASYGESHPEYAEALRVSTQTYLFDENSYAEHLDEMRRAVSIARASYGPKHELRLRAEADLGVMLLHRKPVSMPAEAATSLKAEGMQQLASVIAEANRQKTPVFAPKLYYARALADRNRGDDAAQALRLLAEAETDAKRYFGASHTMRFRIPFSRASVSYNLGDLRAAEAQLIALTPQVEAALPQVHARFALTNIFQLRAKIASQQGDRDRTRALLVRMRDTATRWLGPEHASARLAREALDELARTD
ncbi:protein kinase domain-containing protein [Lysobacter sp. CA196]|uniref:serine/threonine protein kinase n=1 Tax=Lysobacter sp. CA196 TaxID=3455606 RepID=UPI003F8D6DDF